MHRNGTYSASQRLRDRDRERHARTQDRDLRRRALLQIPLTSRERLLATSATTASSSTSPPTTADSETTADAGSSPFNWLDLDRGADAKAEGQGDLYFAIVADELHALSPPFAMSTSEAPEKPEEASPVSSAVTPATAAGQQPEEQLAVAEQPREYKTYKRRWFGLLQLVLLNIIVSWDVRDLGALLSRC